MPARLEHANLTVHDLDGVVRFLRTAFPEFRVRHDSIDLAGRRWVHVGTEDTYVALSQSAEAAPPQNAGFNHLAYEVDDVGTLRDRLLSGGFRESGRATHHPHRRRMYFHDPDGNEWEFVEYFTADPAQRNDYELADQYEAVIQAD
jgi:catechol 2,3-dioxygenase-like lactoylglutathione lyase family enzyme